MAFQVSPGVSTAEVDLTTRVPIPSLSQGALCSIFKWGPLHEVVTVSSEDDMVERFGKPTGDNFQDWFTGANFLMYANTLRIVRTANTSSAKNAVSNGAVVLVQNEQEYQNTAALSGEGTAGRTWIAKHAGDLGNTFKTSICLPTRANTQVDDGVVSLAANTDVELTGLFVTAASGVCNSKVLDDGNAEQELEIGDIVVNPAGDGSNVAIVTAVANSSQFTATLEDGTSLLAEAATDITVVRKKRSAFAEPYENMMGTVAYLEASPTTLTGTNTHFTKQIYVGDIITVDDETGDQRRRVTAISSDISLTVDQPYTLDFTAKPYTREWEFNSDFSKEPLTSDFAYKTTGNKDVNDEIHIVLVDENGDWTGTKDVRGATRVVSPSVLEIYPAVSVANGATSSIGESNYYKDYINNHSEYIRWGDHTGVGDVETRTGTGGAVNTINHEWGGTLTTGDSASNNSFRGSFSDTGYANGIVTESFSGGNDGSAISDADRINGWKKFTDPNTTDISFILSGEASDTLSKYLIQEVAENRKDCVAFISPLTSDVVNNDGNEVTAIVDRRNQLPSSSYAVMDGNYKYMLDRFNGIFRYVPLNGDIAGVCAQADTGNPYISPAGFSRGNVKGVTKLAFNPTRSNRDDLYVKGINNVVSFPGQGTILFGDKTLLAKPSAFDRINVRRLFIILEKAIANAAQFSLFEFNDEFTRAQFIAIIDPFLRDVQAQRGIVDYSIICDGTNNPPVVVDRNEFRGDIYVKPNRAINFISLNFVAVASGVQFSEVVQ